MRLLRPHSGIGAFLAGVICVVSAASAETITPQPVDGKIRWLYSYADGQRLAQETHKPLFVVFRCER